MANIDTSIVPKMFSQNMHSIHGIKPYLSNLHFLGLSFISFIIPIWQSDFISLLVKCFEMNAHNLESWSNVSQLTY